MCHLLWLRNLEMCNTPDVVPSLKISFGINLLAISYRFWHSADSILHAPVCDIESIHVYLITWSAACMWAILPTDWWSHNSITWIIFISFTSTSIWWECNGCDVLRLGVTSSPYTHYRQFSKNKTYCTIISCTCVKCLKFNIIRNCFAWCALILERRKPTNSESCNYGQLYCPLKILNSYS